MAYEPRLITPFDNGGLEEYYKPWLIGDQAFTVLEDAYPWRGTIRKREGFSLLGTLPTTTVQGILNYIIPSSGDPQLIGFSLTKAYLFNNTTSVFNDISFFSDASAVSWTGGADDFFWGANYKNALWVTNNVDPLRFWNGNTANGWSNQKPILSGTDRLIFCLIVIPYKGRLVILNTNEQVGGVATQFSQRARWSQLGTPYVDAAAGDVATVPPTGFATDNNAWRSDIPGRGGFIDADTTERIVSCAIIKDILIVFFQKSTWRLRYTGNEVLPFIWERINTQYGSEGTWSTIPFDQAALTFSRYGYVASDTNNVGRIDEKIPDQTFINTNLGTTLKSLQRIQGIRDFYRQTAYWTYPDMTTNSSTPDRVLAYNYLDKTWARFKQSFRCFGYYQLFNDIRWQDELMAWEDNDDAWEGVGAQANFPQVCAGDVANGNIYTVYDIEGDAQDNTANFGFNIVTKQFNPYLGEGHRCRFQYVDIYCTRTNGGQITVDLFQDDNENSPILTRTVNIDTTNNAKYVRVFFGLIGRVFKLRFYLTDAQIADPQIGAVRFELQGLVIWTRREGRLKQ